MHPSTQPIASLGSGISINTGFFQVTAAPPTGACTGAALPPRTGSHESKAYWKNQETFALLAGTVPELRDAVSDVSGINVNLGSAHFCEHARLVEAFKATTTQAETQLRVDATAEAHGEAVVMQGADWMSLIH